MDKGLEKILNFGDTLQATVYLGGERFVTTGEVETWLSTDGGKTWAREKKKEGIEDANAY